MGSKIAPWDRHLRGGSTLTSMTDTLRATMNTADQTILGLWLMIEYQGCDATFGYDPEPEPRVGPAVPKRR
jgi:hypothetical protein